MVHEFTPKPGWLLSDVRSAAARVEKWKAEKPAIVGVDKSDGVEHCVEVSIDKDGTLRVTDEYKIVDAD